jgi:hypothetical protein
LYKFGFGCNSALIGGGWSSLLSVCEREIVCSAVVGVSSVSLMSVGLSNSPLFLERDKMAEGEFCGFGEDRELGLEENLWVSCAVSCAMSGVDSVVLLARCDRDRGIEGEGEEEVWIFVGLVMWREGESRWRFGLEVEMGFEEEEEAVEEEGEVGRKEEEPEEGVGG